MNGNQSIYLESSISGGYHYKDCFAHDDGVQRGPHHDATQQQTDPFGHDDATVLNDLNFSEFFDFQNAALESESVLPPLGEQQLTSAAAPVTLCSQELDGTLWLPSLASQTLTYLPQSDLAHDVSKSTRTAGSQLFHGPSEYRTVQTQFVSVSGNKDAPQLPNSKKRALESTSPGLACLHFGVVSNSSKKRRKPTAAQRDDTKRVRAQGACLRCYVQKLKCSEGRPCEKCQQLFSKAYGSKTLEWTACISSNLPEINIFSLGISFSEGGFPRTTNGPEPLQKLDLDLVSCIYKVSFELGSSSAILPDIDSLYSEVLRHIYGQRAPEIHPFILQERNPLYMLIQLNVILLGSPVIGHKLFGYVRHIQTLRAVCAVLAFEYLGRALSRITLAAATPHRQLALIIQASLLLDQVVEMEDDVPAAMVCVPHDKSYADMHQHLKQYLNHYLRKLISGVFGKYCDILTCFQINKCREYWGGSFWNMLSDLIPSVPLRRPPKLRRYAEMNWETYDTGLEQMYRQLYSSPTRYPSSSSLGL